MAPNNGPSWCETLLRLRAGEHAPPGYEIKRVIGVYEQPIGAGTNSEKVYVVAVRSATRGGKRQ